MMMTTVEVVAVVVVDAPGVKLLSMLTSNFQLFKILIQSWRRIFYLLITTWCLSLWFIFSLLIIQNMEANNMSNSGNPIKFFYITPWLSESLITTSSYTVSNFFDRGETIDLETNIETQLTFPQTSTLSLMGSACDVQDSNLEFETGDFRCWNIFTNPPSLPPNLLKVVPTDFSTNSALLGDPSQHDNSPLGPNGSLTISHIYKVTIPNQGNPQLQFDYLMYSYDVIYAVQNNKFFDFLEVGIITSTMTPLKQYGNPSLDWDGYASVCRPTPWASNSGKVAHEVISLDKYKGQTIAIYFTLYNKTDGSCNSWAFLDNVKIKPELTLTKSNIPSGPIHEGDIITYTISYTNTSLATQTNAIITDILPFNVTLITNSVPPTVPHDSTLVWNLGDIPLGGSGHVSFAVRVPLLPILSPELVQTASSLESSLTYVLPAAVTCDSTRFWATGVTAQPKPPSPYTLQVRIPPGANPSEMWLLIKGTNPIAPTVDGQLAQHLQATINSFGASLWSAPITPAMVTNGQVTVITQDSRDLNALFLLDKDDPPFHPETLYDLYQTTKTFTYTLDIPSVESQTIDVLLPYMDVTYWQDEPLPDTRLTTVTIEFNGQIHTALANDPNLGNGLLMTQFLFEIHEIPNVATATKTLTVTVDTEDSIYSFGPRVCRPVYIQNTAWLCSDQAGCISATATNIPDSFRPPTIYLPIVLKSS
jgi:uncharacterized repeat protein (TIGR01451 family)